MPLFAFGINEQGLSIQMVAHSSVGQKRIGTCADGVPFGCNSNVLVWLPMMWRVMM